MTAIRQEVRTLSSQWLDGSLMYPGRYTFTWLRVGLVWHLVGMEPVK